MRPLVVGVLVLAQVGVARGLAPTIDFAGRQISIGADRATPPPTHPAACPTSDGYPSAIARKTLGAYKLRWPDGTHIIEASAHHLLFASNWRNPAAVGAVYELPSERELARFADEPAALVEGPGGELLGLVAIDEKAGVVKRLDASGHLRWRTSVKGLGGDVARAVLVGDRLYVAPFDAISTSTQLYAFDWKTGAFAWRGDVREIHAAHSEYEQDLRLSVREGRVVVEDVQSAGCTLQTFDPANGQRRLEVTLLPGGWGS